jgi:hypothetical protein
MKPVHSLSPSQPVQRAPRAHFAEPTIAVLRLKDGRRVPGKLKVVSVTGGLLAVTHPVDTGCKAKLMFLTASGMVLGSAEMLHPISWTLQPFRFVGLDHDAEDRLKAVVRARTVQADATNGQIERSRAW